VVVVDNGSSDTSVEAIRETFPQITLLETGANLGYAGGNNFGIQWALFQKFDYILLLNNDTIVHSDSLNLLSRAAQADPTAGVYGPKIYFAAHPTKIWFAGARWEDSILDFRHLGSNEDDSANFSYRIESDYITGCALFASADVFRKVGLLDERYFLTFEEVDWCYRARAAGYRCIYVPDAKIWHKVSASFGGADSPLIEYFMTRNRLVWVRRHLDFKSFFRLQSKCFAWIWGVIFHKLHVSRDAPFGRRYLWALSLWVRRLRKRLEDPFTLARLFGIRDFYCSRRGDSPQHVRDLKYIDSKPKSHL